MSEDKKTKEPQYRALFDVVKKRGIATFGLMSNQVWDEDPKRTLFTLARYKFVAKMFDGKKNVLEIGCADAFGTRIVQQSVDKVTAIDFDPVFIDDVKSRTGSTWPLKCFVHDILAGPVPGIFNAAFALDVLEHIHPDDEDRFIKNIMESLDNSGILIIGTPSLESQIYASSQSKEGHINCKSGRDLKLFMEKYFNNVFIFSMNDEVVHTGFYPMAHYLFAIGCSKKML